MYIIFKYIFIILIKVYVNEKTKPSSEFIVLTSIVCVSKVELLPVFHRAPLFSKSSECALIRS